MFHVPEKYRNRNHKILSSDSSYGNNGLFEFMYIEYHVRCIVSDGEGWEHVSVSLLEPIIPSWEIMCHVKDLFWGREDTVIQFHPPKSQYVNNHPRCLHLWRPTGIIIPLPDKSLVG